jgi:cell wall-associated NlpC family hydrolase
VKTDGLDQSRAQVNAWATGMGTALDIPARVLAGYANAELVLRSERPDCHLSWVTLAGIGKASSDHGRAQGAAVNSEGITTPALNTVPLQGALPQDVSTRATQSVRSGPMQLSANQWAGRENTPTNDIQNIDDSALAAGRALCAQGVDLANSGTWWNSILAFRDSELFRQQVLGNAQLYATISLDPNSLASKKSSAISTQAVRFALSQLGLPYVWGGNGPDGGSAGFDCSGLTKAAYDHAGFSLPRTADSQFRSTRAVSTPELGDLVFYGNPATKIHHVGLYLGNGLMINAPTQGQAVQIHSYHLPGDDYVGAGRPVG